MIHKTKSTINTLNTFDLENEIKHTKRLVSVTPIPKTKKIDLTPSERDNMKLLHTFTEKELDELILLFKKYQHSNCLSPRSYWRMIGPVLPLLPYQTPYLTILQQRIYSVFHVAQNIGINLVSFLLSIAVLCDKATFMTRAHLASNIFFLKKDTIDIIEMYQLLNDERISNNTILFSIDNIEITCEMFIHAWCGFLRQIGKVVTRDVFENALLTHPSCDLLLFPFGIHDYKLLK